MAFRKTFRGSLRHDWPVVAIFEDEDERRWYLQCDHVGENNWRPLKLSLRGKIEGKANYHAVWNGERFAKNSETEKLETTHADLFETIRQTLPNVEWPEMRPVEVISVAPVGRRGKGPENGSSTPQNQA